VKISGVTDEMSSSKELLKYLFNLHIDKINFRFMRKNGFETKGFSLGDHVFPHFRGQSRSLVTQPFRVIRIHSFGDQIGIDELDTVFGQVLMIKSRLTRAVATSQHSELLLSGHQIASKVPF